MNKPIFDIYAMCSILKRQGIESSEYTDCTILYTVTFEQLRNLFTEGYQTGLVELLPLQRQVAMLVGILKRASTSLGSFCSDEGWAQSDMDTMDSVDAAIANTQATAEAYDREHAEKVLEEAAKEFDGKDYGANELRAMAYSFRLK